MLDRILNKSLIFTKNPPGKYEAFFLYLATGLLLTIIATAILVQGKTLLVEMEKVQSLLVIAAIAIAIFPPCRFTGFIKWSAALAFIMNFR
jgi:hypothetical protein